MQPISNPSALIEGGSPKTDFTEGSSLQIVGGDSESLYSDPPPPPK